MERTCWVLVLGLLGGVVAPAWGQSRDRVAAQCQGGLAAGFACNRVDLVAHLPVASFAVGERFVPTGANDVWGWTDTATGREYALAEMRQGVVFVEVTHPEAPVFLGALPTHTAPTTWRDIKVHKNHAFIVADDAMQHAMQVFDLTQLRDVQEPTLFAETARYTGIGSAHNLVINEETGFAYSVGSSGGDHSCGPGLHMIDIRTPTAPQFAGCFNSSIHRGYTHDAQCVVYRGPDEAHRGKEICIGADERGIAISDVTDKSGPVELSATTYPTAAYTHQGWLTEDHRYFYLNDENDELSFNLSTNTYIWDLVDLEAPELVAEHRANTTSTDHNLYIVGDYMYQANYGAGFRLLDISDRLNPVVVLADGSNAAVVVDAEDALALPEGFLLSAAYPNPFNPVTTLDLTLPAAEDVTVAVFDLLGRNVAVLHDGMLPAGTHALRFGAAGLPGGTCFVRAAGARTQHLRPVFLVK